MPDEATHLLRAVMAHEVSPREVERLGFQLTTQDPRATMSVAYPGPNPPVVTFSLGEIARGLLSALDAEDGAYWANVILMVDSFDFGDAIESDDGGVLLDALWDLSAGEPLSDEGVEVVRRLAAPD